MAVQSRLKTDCVSGTQNRRFKSGGSTSLGPEMHSPDGITLTISLSRRPKDCWTETVSPSTVTDRKHSVHICLQTKYRRHISNADKPSIRRSNVEAWSGTGTFPAATVRTANVGK